MTIEGYLVYCNRCLTVSSFQKQKQNFYLTTCGKVCCEKCISNFQCNKCPKCSSQIIQESMGQGMEFLFQDNSNVIKEIAKTHVFQQNRFKQLIKFQQAKIFQLEKKYFDKSKQFIELEEKYVKMKESFSYLNQQMQEQQSRQNQLNYLSKQHSFNSKVLNSLGKHFNGSIMSETSGIGSFSRNSIGSIHSNGKTNSKPVGFHPYTSPIPLVRANSYFNLYTNGKNPSPECDGALLASVAAKAVRASRANLMDITYAKTPLRQQISRQSSRRSLKNLDNPKPITRQPSRRSLKNLDNNFF